MPSTLMALGELPLTPAGKADRITIQALLYEHIRSAPSTDPLVYLYNAVSRWLGERISRDAGGLLELGVGSLVTARLTAELTCRYDVHIALSDVISAPSLADLASLIRRRMP
jgi:hypothetical protein